MNLMPLFSVIIPTYQRNDLLAKCLYCLAPDIQTLPFEQYEVIVTDDGSEVTAKQMICERFPWVKWVSGSHKGPAANRNNGAKYASGEWLVFTDDDCLPDPQWLAAYAQAMITQRSYLVFEGRTYVDRPRRSLAETSPINETGGYLWSCNFAVQKQLFESLSGFDERFPYAAMEDVDFRLRLVKSGYKFSFVKAASVCHPWRAKGGWNKIKQHRESTFIYLSIHAEEWVKINSMYYFLFALRSFVNQTFPAILRFNLNGINEAFLEHFAYLQMSVLLWQYRLANTKTLNNN
ncbi:glycosyltransferase [Chroococcidiopsis sp. FACHB-1243]|uniref:glycosyltransferase family 2 protein n=1 Tax=Chroococcidiopsis sp. [FACHB-1243] TaxID=2692781 RepID=UPI00177AC5B8|nr:glycosyltransferase [Chroococcidiopsis sp. [FACHB-1243]]MBD2308309.1 glycosyltransferase [Chroococcidiopsis sp. [FACHB-1243]]